MAIVADWTKSLDVARLHADPSGVQEMSTTFQALLFPGMSTQTARLRYISLLAAARNYHMKLESEVNIQLPLSEYMRRFEALIVVSSVLHHVHDGNEPDGIVGRTAGRNMSRQETFELKTDYTILITFIAGHFLIWAYLIQHPCQIPCSNQLSRLANSADPTAIQTHARAILEITLRILLIRFAAEPPSDVPGNASGYDDAYYSALPHNFSKRQSAVQNIIRNLCRKLHEVMKIKIYTGSNMRSFMG
jgi:hypothetical protein